MNISINENFIYPANVLKNKLKEVIKEIDLRMYPEPYAESLMEKLAVEMKLNANQFVVGNGSDTIIDILVRAEISQNNNAIIVSPTFSMYEKAVQLRNGGIKKILLSPPPDYDIDPNLILSQVENKQDSVLFLCSPNNPTGKQYCKEKIQKIIEEFEGIVALDEAYVGFGQHSFVEEINKYPNLIILRTFSKEYGLAGIRIGYCISTEQQAEKMRGILPPFNVNTIAIELAKKLLKERSILEKTNNYIRKERKRVYQRLSQLDGIIPYPSEANFIMFKTTRLDSTTLYTNLTSKGIIIRNLENYPLCEDCLRVTIAHKEMNEHFLAELELIMENIE